MTLVVDRIEGEYVICENGDSFETTQYHKSLMPERIREGDVVVLMDGVFKIDYARTEEREREVKEQLGKITGKNCEPY